MPRMHCQGTSLEIPSNGKICPKLPTNMVPRETKCEVTCSSGTPNFEVIKCELDGWSVDEVICTGTPTGLVVGLLVGGIIVVCIIAYVYARWKGKITNKKKGVSSGSTKSQPLTRAAQIAARNDMVVTGVVSQAAIKTGVARQAPKKASVKLVTGQPEENEYRYHSEARQWDSPPSYNSMEERSGKSNSSSKSSKSRRYHEASSGRSEKRKHRPSYNEYTEDVDIGYQEDMGQPALNGHFYSIQDNGPMYPDCYGPGTQMPQQSYGAMDQNYYSQSSGFYDDGGHGVDNTGYGYSNHEKPYHVPI